MHEERAAEADDLAAMLVRMAEAERGKAASTAAALELGAKVKALEGQLAELQSREQAQAGAAAHLEASRLRIAELEETAAELRAHAADLGQRLETARTEADTARAQVTGGGARARAGPGRAAAGRGGRPARDEPREPRGAVGG